MWVSVCVIFFSLFLILFLSCPLLFDAYRAAAAAWRSTHSHTLTCLHTCTHTACASECANNYKLQPISFCFLGPTTAAGAIGCAHVVTNHLQSDSRHKYGKDGTIDDFVANNDSFNFYRMLNDDKYHVITGHTGTNVMDLHILFIPPSNSYTHKLWRRIVCVCVLHSWKNNNIMIINKKAFLVKIISQ